MYKILIIDDDSTMRLVLKKSLEKVGYEVTATSNGEEGLIEAKKNNPSLILCDWMMPVMDGLEVCKQIKADDGLSSAFFILLTARGDVKDKIKGLDTGADDFVSKPIDLNELKARVRAGIRLYELNQALRNQKQVLEELNQKLQRELDEAAEYVRSLLPAPLVGQVKTDSLFHPSAQLGGDCFDYYWLDQDNLAIYLLDVSGHGVGAALLSVSVLNVLRSQSLPQTNFYQPSAVLNALNRNFQMLNGDKYFTIWYGVYNLSKKQITYSNAGHPPALMISGNSSEKLLVHQLGCPSIPIGILPEGEFIDEHFDLQPSSVMYIFSDGVYEIQLSSGKIWGLEAFSNLLATNHHCQLQVVMNEIRNFTGAQTFEDDFSLLKLKFE